MLSLPLFINVSTLQLLLTMLTFVFYSKYLFRYIMMIVMLYGLEGGDWVVVVVVVVGVVRG